MKSHQFVRLLETSVIFTNLRLFRQGRPFLKGGAGFASLKPKIKLKSEFWHIFLGGNGRGRRVWWGGRTERR